MISQEEWSVKYFDLVNDKFEQFSILCHAGVKNIMRYVYYNAVDIEETWQLEIFSQRPGYKFSLWIYACN